MSSGRHVTVRLRPGSDGDATHVPASGVHTQIDPPTLYLEKTAQQWMTRRGEARPGVKYILESLPAGYTMWQRPRPADPRHVDKYLYGHPSKKKFDSPNRFYPHFEYIMDNEGDSMGCPCTLCAGASGVLPKSSSSSIPVHGSSTTSSSQPPTPKVPASLSRRKSLQSRIPQIPKTVQVPLRPQVPTSAPHLKGRPKLTSTGLDTTRVDDEGSPDVYRNLIDKLKRHESIDEAVQEPLSLDWRGEQELIPEMQKVWDQNDQWVPRIGDIVLYIRIQPDNVEIVQHEETGTYQLYDEQAEMFVGFPSWEAGLVGQIPTQTATIKDLGCNSTEENVIYSGVRVEPLPGLNDLNKTQSKQYKYIPLRQTRPMTLWKELLHGYPRTEWHPTIDNALITASTLSLVGKYRFRGKWPSASIYCHGIYVGFELLAVGDTVRLLPSSKPGQISCSDIMVIKSIRLKWTNMDMASDNDYDEGRPYRSEIWLYGSAYTEDQSRSNKSRLSDKNAKVPRAAAGYATWSPLHPASKELALPYFRVLGRLHERTAMAYFLNSEPEDMPSIDVGREGLLEAREYSCEQDKRIARDGKATWYWGDSRADALDLATINGLDTSKHDLGRDVKEWRKKIKQLEKLEADAPKAHTAPANRDFRRFMAPGSLPATLNRSKEINLSESEEERSSRRSRDTNSQKRHLTVTEDNDPDDEEIRRFTKVIEEPPIGTAKKKAKVMVIVD